MPEGLELLDPAYQCDPTEAGWCSRRDIGCEPYRRLLCKDGLPIYKVIEFGDTTYEYLAPGTEKYYVYRATEACNYLTFRADPLWGDPNLFIYHLSDFKGYLEGVFENQRPIREGGFFGPDRISICPGQIDYPFKPGTHVIVAYPFDSLLTATGPAGTNFTLQVLSKPLPSPSPTASIPCQVPEEASTWHEPDGTPIPIQKWQCLNDGVSHNFTSKSGDHTRYFVYTVPAKSACQHLYWYHWTYGIYIGYAFGSDVKVPYEVGGYQATDHNLVSFSGNPKGDFLLACPSATHDYHLLIKVQPNPRNYFRTEDTDFNAVYIDSSYSYRWLEKISDKNPYVATWDLQMSSQLRCKNSRGEITKRQCNFRLDVGEEAAECSRFWHYYPSDIPIPIFPLNTWLFGDTRFVNFYPKISSEKGDDRSYFAAALIEYQLDLTQAPISAHENSEALLDTCEITFMGSIVDFNGVPLAPRSYPLVPREENCRYEMYRDVVVPKMMELSRQTREAKGAVDVRDFRVSMDILAYSPYYYDCITFASGLVETEAVTRTISSKVCNPEHVNFSDPCCNSSMTFSGDECNARELSYAVQKFEKLTTSASEMCQVAGSAQCSSLFAADYVIASENARSSLEGCGVNTPNIATYTGQHMRSFRNLSDYWLGVDPGIGHRCRSDADCSLIVGARCDLLRGSCLYLIDQLVQNFLQDWVPTLPYLLKNLTSNGITEAMSIAPIQFDDPIAWFNALTSSSDCTGRFNWGWGYRQSYGRAYTLDLNQAVCNLGEKTNGENYCPFRYCFSSSCTVEFACQTTLGANLACWSTFAPLRITSDCMNAQEQSIICNWTPTWNRPSISSSGTPAPNANCFVAGEYMCALCEADTEQPCLRFENIPTQTSCESQYACFLHDGTIVATNSELECQSMMRCNSTCYDSSNRQLRACSQSECESGTSGMCDSHVWSYRPDGAYRPACVTPPVPLWGEKTDCPAIPGIKPDEFGRSTPHGCIYYQNATSQPNCAAYGPSAKPWYTATSAAECEAPNACWQVWDDVNFRNDHTFTFKPTEACKEVDGEMRSFHRWLPATWQGGITRPLKWLRANGTTTPFPLQRTVNLIVLTTAFKRAIESSYSILQSTETFCRYNPILRSMAPVLCSCANDGAKDASECFPPPESAANSKDTASASFTICQGYGNFEQRAAPVTITFARTTIEGGCHPASINIFPASTFAQSSTEALSTFLLDFSVSKPYQFTNKNGALAAQIISDGVIITSDFRMTDVWMCINPRLDIVVNNSFYTKFDFASVDFTQSNPKPSIIFMEGAVRDLASDSVCAHFPSLESDRAYFAIVRSPDARNRKKSFFPTGETVFYALMCVIYGAASCLAAFRFIAAILAGQLVPRNTQIWIFLTISIMMFLRWLYLVLILSGAAVGNSNSAIDYFLVELPSFLYLTIMTFFIIIWATLIKANRTLTKKQNNANFWIIFAILNGVIYLIFLILIIIYEAVRPKQASRCGGRLVTLDQKVRQRTAIAYRAILATFALIISLAFFITGISIYKSLKSTTNQRALRKRKIFWLTSVCSVGLLALSALLIALATTGAKNNFAALGLLVLFEAVPCILIIFSLWKVESKDTMVGNKRLDANNEAMQPLRSYGQAESASRAAPWAKH